MFLRIEGDTFVNLNNVFSYKLSEDRDSFKLMFWGSNGNIINTAFYLKSQPDQIELLRNIVSSLRDITINPDLAIYNIPDNFPNEDFVNEDDLVEGKEPKHIEEYIPSELE